MAEQKSVRINVETYDKLISRKHFGQSLDGIIAELLYEFENALCPLCGKHSADSLSHKECADREAFLADR